MPSAVATERLGSRLFIASYDHDPGATTAIITSADGGTTKRVYDMRDGLYFAVQARPTVVGGTGLTKLEIVAATDAAITTPVVIKETTVAGDSLNDTVFLECSASEIAQAGTDNSGAALRYVAARLTMGTGTDEANVTYIVEPKFPQSGLTATSIT